MPVVPERLFFTREHAQIFGNALLRHPHWGSKKLQSIELQCFEKHPGNKRESQEYDGKKSI